MAKVSKTKSVCVKIEIKDYECLLIRRALVDYMDETDNCDDVDILRPIVEGIGFDYDEGSMP